MIREMIGKIKSTGPFQSDRLIVTFFVVSVNYLLRVDPPGLVDLFEQQESSVFRFPARRQKESTLEPREKKHEWPHAKILKSEFGRGATIHKITLHHIFHHPVNLRKVLISVQLKTIECTLQDFRRQTVTLV